MSINKKLGIGLYFVFGIVIGLSPFISGILYDLYLIEEYRPLTWQSWGRAAVGFVFVFGSEKFNELTAIFIGGIRGMVGNLKNKT